MGHARLVIDARLMRQLLEVPEDIKVLGISYDPMGNCCVMHLEGERLPEVEQGVYPPLCNVTLTLSEGGRVSMTWELPDR